MFERRSVLRYKVSNFVDVSLTQRQISQDPNVCHKPQQFQTMRQCFAIHLLLQSLV